MKARRNHGAGGGRSWEKSHTFHGEMAAAKRAAITTAALVALGTCKKRRANAFLFKNQTTFGVFVFSLHAGRIARGPVVSRLCSAAETPDGGDGRERTDGGEWDGLDYGNLTNAIRDIVAAMTVDCTLAVHTGVESTGEGGGEFVVEENWVFFFWSEI